ncbi:MAG: DNA-deoxyinosine glycosylase [Brevundimonas sp.]|uniref:DNA-deoxyinosine glycosylase n=1 Tax=Brevundimonas sp. TaxID=1871086 RepID=UPI0011F95B0B|nr:DNA-deoxyinosine glycosylase [Brevundimonas sp.]RZJ18661.1 MAG: DNA-deoxyinosine glycosylase [Brevundimonas sp.]
MLRRAFDPVVDANTRLLILGSLPGEASLAAGQYYAHPRNAFWRLMSALLEQADLHERPYEARLATLRARGVGLWDTVAEAERIGSLDSAIRLPTHADLPGLMAALPNLRAVAFNGGKAAKLGERILAPANSAAARLTLPSSSPAMARPLAWKAEQWAVLKPFLADA